MVRSGQMSPQLLPRRVLSRRKPSSLCLRLKSAKQGFFHHEMCPINNPPHRQAFVWPPGRWVNG
jgi:hypothetical protein